MQKQLGIICWSGRGNEKDNLGSPLWPSEYSIS